MRIKKNSKYHSNTMEKVEYLVQHMQPPTDCTTVGKQYIFKTAINLLYNTVRLDQERREALNVEN